MEEEIVNIATVTKSEQRQIVSEMKAHKGILLEVLAYAMKTRPNSLGCVFCLNEGNRKDDLLQGVHDKLYFLDFNMFNFLENVAPIYLISHCLTAISVSILFLDATPKHFSYSHDKSHQNWKIKSTLT